MATMALTTAGWFSPRTWGCFYPCSRQGRASRVFPTHVGVFLDLTEQFGEEACFPHARGGVSIGATA